MSTTSLDQDPAPLSRDELAQFRDDLAPELRQDDWYTILTAASTSCHAGAEAVPLIYQLATEGIDSDSEAKRIQQRIQESLVKGAVIYGIPSSLDSCFGLLSHIRSTQPERLLSASDFARSGLCEQPLSAALTPRAFEGLTQVYRHNLPPILEGKMASNMEDLKFLTLQINYGWNLAEYSVLDFKSTEAVVLAALVPQNARLETLWHLRGARRAGWSDEAVNSIRDTLVSMARRCGLRTGKVPSLDEVEEQD